MIKYNLAVLYNVLMQPNHMAIASQCFPGQPGFERIREHPRFKELETYVALMKESMTNIGASATLIQIKLLEILLEHNKPASSVISKCADIEYGMYLDLDGKPCILLPDVTLSNLNHANPFGTAVTKAFPSAMPDIMEATKALNLEMPAACAFHLLRVTELALRKTLNLLNIPKPRGDSWGLILGDIEAIIYAIPRPTMTPKLKFAKDMHSHITSLKALRDKRTMHVDEPAPTTKDAKSLFNQVRVLMQYVAKHLDEAGTFTP